MNSRFTGVSIFQWNANGLKGKLGDFRRLVLEQKFPILAISEGRLNANFRLSNYVIYSSSRPHNKPSRAILCVRKDITCCLVEASSGDLPEYVACKVQFGSLIFNVVSVYAEPKTALMHNI